MRARLTVACRGRVAGGSCVLCAVCCVLCEGGPLPLAAALHSHLHYSQQALSYTMTPAGPWRSARRARMHGDVCRAMRAPQAKMAAQQLRRRHDCRRRQRLRCYFVPPHIQHCQHLRIYLNSPCSLSRMQSPCGLIAHPSAQRQRGFMLRQQQQLQSARQRAAAGKQRPPSEVLGGEWRTSGL